MSTLLEQLFEQATTKCNELGEDIDQASSAVDAILQNSQKLGERLENGAREVGSALKALTGRIEQAESELEDKAGEAEDALEDATGKAGDAREALQALSERADPGSTAVDEAAEQASEGLTSGMEAATQGFNDLGRKVSEFSQSTAQRVERMQANLDAFGKEVDDARDDLEQKKEAWLKALDGLTETVTRESRETVEALGAILKEQAGGMLEAGNGVVMDHNEAMDAMKTAFATQAVDALDAALSPVSEALQAIGVLAGTRSAELSERVRTAASRIEAIAPGIDQLSERLRKASAL